jgi:cullin 1
MNHSLVELEDGWKQIQDGAIARLHEILENDLEEGNRKFDNKEYMTYFTLVYNMCTQKPPHNYSEQLYQRYKKAIADYLTAHVLPAVRSQTGQYMLKEIGKRWTHHKINVKWMKSFFSYLDRFHTKRQNLPSMRDVGMQCFKDVIHEATSTDVRTAILDLVEQERLGQQVDHGLLKSVVEIFVEMGMGELEVYINDFESQFLEDTSAFYAREAQRWLQEDGLPDYLIKAEEHLKLEGDRVANYLHNSTEEKLLKVINKELLEVHQTQLMQKEATGLEALLRDDKKDELARLYRLYLRLPTGLLPADENQYGLQAVSKMVKTHIEMVGTDLVKGQVGANSGGDEFINQLIALHTKYATLVKDCFADNSLFHKALKDAHEVFMNIDLRGKGDGASKKSKGNGSSMPELLAAYCDNLLKKGGVKLEEEQIEERLEKVVQLFSYLQDKDMFNEYYRKALAKRLLNDKSASDELERSLISKLKLRCGQQFTTKLDGMITDISLATELKAKYDTFKRDDKESEAIADISVTVGTNILTFICLLLSVLICDRTGADHGLLAVIQDGSNEYSTRIDWLLGLVQPIL